jgi:hypothetical protein
MKKIVLKKKLNVLINELPETKLQILYELACFLQSRHGRENQELFRMQMNSKAYEEWLGAENDIYDKAFRDEIKKK